jgi:hypothetical protein
VQPAPLQECSDTPECACGLERDHARWNQALADGISAISDEEFQDALARHPIPLDEVLSGTWREAAS